MPNFDTILLNKTDANSNMTFEHLNTIFHHVRGKHKQPFTFWYCVDNFYPWKDIVGKKVSKWRSITELRAFYGRKSPARPVQISSIVLYIVQWANKKLAGRGTQIVFPHKPESSEKIQTHSWNCTDRGYNFYVRHFPAKFCLFWAHCLYDNIIGHRCIGCEDQTFCHMRTKKDTREGRGESLARCALLVSFCERGRSVTTPKRASSSLLSIFHGLQYLRYYSLQSVW